MTDKYVTRKAATFSPEQVHEAIVRLSESNNPRQRLGAMHILLSYYGLLRMNDVLKIKSDDISYDKKDSCWKVTFNYQRKRKNEGFSFLILKIYTKIVWN